MRQLHFSYIKQMQTIASSGPIILPLSVCGRGYGWVGVCVGGGVCGEVGCAGVCVCGVGGGGWGVWGVCVGCVWVVCVLNLFL